MALTYEPISTTTLGAGATSVTFSSIPSTYTDLVLIVNDTNGTGADSLNLRFNGDTGTNYSSTRIQGDGSSAQSNRNTNATSMNIGFTSNTLSTSIIQIMNYANTTTNKTALGRGNNAGVEVSAKVGLWRSTAAINSIVVITGGGYTFQTGSTFTLYGIKAA